MKKKRFRPKIGKYNKTTLPDGSVTMWDFRKNMTRHFAKAGTLVIWSYNSPQVVLTIEPVVIK